MGSKNRGKNETDASGVSYRMKNIIKMSYNDFKKRAFRKMSKYNNKQREG